MNKKLLRKYNVQGPRYTSYPTVPFWDESTFSKDKWIESFKKSFYQSNSTEGISLYIHLPFCESLCTFCACHKHVTRKHSYEENYIDLLLKEWKLYTELVEEIPCIKEIHLGGGTPTFFSSDNLQTLINGLFQNAVKHNNYEFSFEGHPNNTTKEHLQTLFDLGFTRVSYGVQDYDMKVQEAINRLQPFENVEKVTNWAREIGYTSVSHDLIFGLPFQTKESIVNTIRRTKELQPDRISFYSYAHVPWIKGSKQRGFSEENLPKDDEKRALYEIGKQMLSELNYIEVGMDHFALKTDNLYIATQNKMLHRNFMGYTANKTQLMIGLGMSSISDSWYAFSQNEKSLKKYTALVLNGEIPVFRGHLLNNEDLIIRRHILNIMCQFETSWENDFYFDKVQDTLDLLKEIQEDGLIDISNNSLKVKKESRPFVRNICMAFDLYLQNNQPQTKLFSMTI